MGGKGSAPAAPDYVGAAQQQAQSSRELTDVQNWANRPTQNTPWGSTSWSAKAATDPATGKPITQWTQNTTLAPELKNALNDQLAIQEGKSDLAQGFMGRVQNEFSQPFNWNGLPQAASLGQAPSLNAGIADYSQGLQAGVNPMTEGLRTGFDIRGPQMGMNPMTQGITGALRQTPVNTGFQSMTGDLARNTGTEQVQRGLNTNDNPALPQFDSGYRDQVATQLMQKMQPVHDYQTRSMETKLENQGLRPGSEAYNRAMTQLGQQQAMERYNALDASGQEAQRLYNMQMGARQQAFNEDTGAGQFANQASNQAFQQGLAANQFQNQAAQQAYQQAMGATQAGNAAQGQAFNQALQAGQFGNQANQQAYNQTLGAFNFGNTAQQQAYNQMMGLANLGNQANQQAFNQNLQAAQFGNQALGQASALDIARQQANNQALQQQFGMNQQAAQFQNQLRQQAIAEEAQRRGMSLNEMNALLSGQQVAMPQMPTFNQAQRSETPQILNAVGQQYDAQLGAYNAQQAGMNNLLNAGAQLGSAAFMFSDRRLKSNIKRIGTHDIGVGIYEYTMMGMPQRGVIAQEVQAVRPDLVKRHANGFLMVNYGGL